MRYSQVTFNILPKLVHNILNTGNKIITFIRRKPFQETCICWTFLLRKHTKHFEKAIIKKNQDKLDDCDYGFTGTPDICCVMLALFLFSLMAFCYSQKFFYAKPSSNHGLDRDSEHVSMVNINNSAQTIFSEVNDWFFSFKTYPMTNWSR